MTGDTSNNRGAWAGAAEAPAESNPAQAEALTDEALVAAYVAGDEPAFDELVGRYSHRVYGICYRYFGNAADAEDAAQDAFVALMRRAETFRGTARFSTWMHRVAVNACNDLGRRRARRPRTVPLDTGDSGPGAGQVPPAADTLPADDLLAVRELNLDLQRALRLLEPEQREAIILHDVQGVQYADIAQRTGVAVGTVKSRVHRGHARLAAALAHLAPRQPAEPSGPPQPPTMQP